MCSCGRAPDGAQRYDKVAGRKGENTKLQGASRQVYGKNTNHITRRVSSCINRVFAFSPVGVKGRKRKNTTNEESYSFSWGKAKRRKVEKFNLSYFYVAGRKRENATKVDFSMFSCFHLFDLPHEYTKISFFVLRGEKAKTRQKKLLTCFCLFDILTREARMQRHDK